MRFKRGIMVEVLSKKRDPSGVWRCAEIVADNGDGYIVKYYRCPGLAKYGVDKVSAEAVRPRPRPAVDFKNLAVGDVVEVLDDGYWRVSIIEQVMDNDYYYIGVIGSLDEFRVKKSSIRARQEWKDNKWNLIDKVSENCVNIISSTHTKSPLSDFTKVQEVPESDFLFQSLKRSYPDHVSTDEAYLKCFQKRRLVDKEVDLDVIHGDAYSFIGKVDNPANQKRNLGKDNVQKFTEKTIRQNNTNIRNYDDFQFLARKSEPDDCVSNVSSVGSCSITNAISDRLFSHSSAGCRQDSASLSSDAESHSHLEEEEEVSNGPLRTHKLDLYSYRCILEALYVSGPLSWQQEAALTNLRMKLYVSNDEHLTELKRLKSIGDPGLSYH